MWGCRRYMFSNTEDQLFCEMCRTSRQRSTAPPPTKVSTPIALPISVPNTIKKVGRPKKKLKMLNIEEIETSYVLGHITVGTS